MGDVQEGGNLSRRDFIQLSGGTLASVCLFSLTLPTSTAVAQEEPVYEVDGLEESAEIIVDNWGIPHMYAASLYDGFFVQGFNAARDRLWQVDLWRRRGLGKLSEVFGADYVQQDRAARLFLYRGDMYEEWLAYSSDTKRIAESFANGINEYIRLVEEDGSLLPPEFEALGYSPERWAPEDIVRIRSHGLTRNVTSEVTRAQILRDYGEKVEATRQRLEPEWEITVPEGLDLSDISDDVLEVYELATAPVAFSGGAVDDPDALATALAPGLPETGGPGQSLARLVERLRKAAGIGSNNWTISPSRTATGRPILANDPHRSHSVPSLRYAAHLSTPEVDVIGAGEPALPGISIGHNGHIAFGLTIFSIDQEDLYVYETNPDSPDEYRYQGDWEPMEVVEEEIPVAGREPDKVRMKFTRHGPVIHENSEKNRAFAVRAAWLEPGMAPYLGSIEYMRATDWDEFVAAMNRWGSPSENQVYADTGGNVGWKPGGLTPVRPNWDGLLPVPGDGRYEWDGFLTQDKLPVEFNPERGWIGTANEMNLPEDYPYERYKLGFEWSEPFRSTRIEEVLSADSHVSLEDAKSLQTDFLSVPARRMGTVLDSVRSEGASERSLAALNLLKGWGHFVTADSAAAALFEVWFSSYLGQALVAELAPEGAREILGAGDARVVLELMESPDDRLGDEPQATRDKVVLQSLEAAYSRVQQLLGDDPATWSWGALHEAYFEHPISAALEEGSSATQEKVADSLDVGPLPMGGANFTVGNVGYGSEEYTGSEDREYFRVASGASWRMVLDVGDWDSSAAINSPGQSGDPRSPHYEDLFETWAAGEYFPLLYSRGAVEGSASQTITLRPRG